MPSRNTDPTTARLISRKEAQHHGDPSTPSQRKNSGHEGMASGNGKNGENQALYIPSWLANPLRTEITRTRITPMCGLSSTKSDYDPEPVSTTPHAGAARSGPRGTMVHEDGPQERVSLDPDPRRGRMEDSVEDSVRSFRIPSYAVRDYQPPLHLPRYDEPYLLQHARHRNFSIHGRHTSLCRH